MNEVFFTNSYKPLGENELKQFEDWLGDYLPTGYRQFILKHNGGQPSKPNLLGPVNCYVQFFYPITFTHRGVSLENEIEKFKDHFPSDIIPICLTGTGDRICLSTLDDKIYYYACGHDLKSLQSDYRASAADYVFLANNIGELLDKLTGSDAPVLDEEIISIGRWGDVQLLDNYLKQGHDINELTAEGGCIVRSAAYKGNLEFIKECVKRGANLHNRGILHAAIFSMEYDVVKYLLEQGVDPNERDEKGHTPLDDALPPAKGPAVQLLRSKGGITTIM